MRARNDVNADKLADAAGGRGSGIGRGFNRRDVAANDRRDKTCADLFIADELTLAAFTMASAASIIATRSFTLDHS